MSRTVVKSEPQKWTSILQRDFNACALLLPIASKSPRYSSQFLSSAVLGAVRLKRFIFVFCCLRLVRIYVTTNCPLFVGLSALYSVQCVRAAVEENKEYGRKQRKKKKKKQLKRNMRERGKRKELAYTVKWKRKDKLEQVEPACG